MNKKSKILLIIFFAAIFVSVGFTYYRIFILKDYIIRLETDCDPAKEKCFIWECDPADDSECPAEIEERISYYKIIEKKASAIPVCESGNDECPEINCAGDAECIEILCDENTMAEGETCNDPKDYIEQIEEESVVEEEIQEEAISAEETTSTEETTAETCSINSEVCATTTENTLQESPDTPEL